ncbi:MAG: hypothetical protein HKL99_06555 [Burkholderiales bacterium]|nr:hypothetical protein [Burkholderiales bacterium]
MHNLSFDSTPVASPVMQWVFQFGGTEGARKNSPQTPALSKQAADKEDDDWSVDVKNSFVTRTPADDLLRSAKQQGGLAATAKLKLPVRSRADEIAEERVALLAQKYVGGHSSREIIARIEILNQRLLEELPRVTPERVAALEDIGNKIAAIRSRALERASRLGLPG